MDSHYNELKELPHLRGTLNTLVSIKANGMRRPPSLSESYAWDPENIERLHYVQQQELRAADASAFAAARPESRTITELVIHYPPNTETRVLNFILRLLFHISLISAFESVFFFFYVSTLEDAGIISVVGGFIQSAVQTCANSTQDGRALAKIVLSYFVNASTVDAAGAAALGTRTQSNAVLANQSWYYVGGCFGLFVACVSYAKCRRVTIVWRKIVLDNAAMVVLLAAYEYMFFSTIIKPYTPITGDEIAQRAVNQLNASCGLF
jgi:hypothetical protein